MSQPIATIGLFDSGIGGLTVLAEVQRAIPQLKLIYLGDTARTPYGTKSPETIRRYAAECANFLVEKGIDALVVACNTASACALSELTAAHSFPVIGTIAPAVRTAARFTKGGLIGVIGTEATIASQVYQRALAVEIPGARVLSQSCPLFVPLVENGLFEGEIVDKVIELYLGDWRDRGVDTLVLGCTHYPLLAQALRKFFGPQVAIVECSKAIAEQLLDLTGGDRANAVDGPHSEMTQYFVTDETSRFNKLAGGFLGLDCLVEAQVAQL